MIDKFKKKVILVLTIIFWGILIGILLTVNIFSYQSNQSETRKLLLTQDVIAKLENKGNVTPPSGDEHEVSRIYSVAVDENERYTVVFSNNDSGYTNDQLIKAAKGIISENKKEGILNHFRYKIANTDTGVMVSFIDYRFWEQQQYQMMINSILIGVSGMIILFFVAFFLTGWLITPVRAAFEKQKQFISDAGHELKTPLTVMKASIDMLQGEHGGNKYFGYIREENKRMTSLVHELLSLSSLEKTNEKANFQKINFSRILEGTCLPFECVAFESGIHLELQIKEGIFILGDEKQLRQMIEILLDNAIKHTYKNGMVIVRLHKEKGKTILEVKNEGEPIPEAERNKIFDRFYRVDKARNRKEGRYGLGLFIASSIVEGHKGKINVDCKENFTIFSVKLS